MAWAPDPAAQVDKLERHAARVDDTSEDSENTSIVTIKNGPTWPMRLKGKEQLNSSLA